MSSRGVPSAAIVAVVHDHQAVAQLLGLVHVVRGEDEGDAALLEAEQAVPDDVPGLRVETGGGLVEDQDVRVVDEAPGDREAALHAAGQRVDLVVGALGELNEVEQLVGALVDQLARQPEVAAVDEQVLAHRQLVVQGVFLRDDAEPGPDRGPVADGVTAENGKITRVSAERHSRACAWWRISRHRSGRGSQTPHHGTRSKSIPSTAVKLPNRFVRPRARTSTSGTRRRIPGSLADSEWFCGRRVLPVSRSVPGKPVGAGKVQQGHVGRAVRAVRPLP